MRFWRKSPAVWDKGGGAGPVSEADLAVNRMLESELRSARPDYGWLSEETPDTIERLDRERVFILDPIDGTRAFLDGDSSFAHSLAVAEQGRIVAAAVYLPAKDLLFTATRGGPALCNAAAVRVSSAAEAEGATMLTSKATFAPEHWPRGVPPLRREFRASLAWRLCLVAEGQFDAMMTLRPTWEWDVAAGALIVERAGGMVSDRTGGALVFNAPDPRLNGVLAAPAGLHAPLIAALA